MVNMRKIAAGVAMAAVIGAGFGAGFIPANAANNLTVAQAPNLTVSSTVSKSKIDPSMIMMEHQLQTNKIRLANGLKALKWTHDGELNSVSTKWASDMADSGKLTTNPNLKNEVPSGSSAFAQDIGIVNGTATVSGWAAADKTKKKGILGNYTHMGVGYKVDKNGKYYLVQTYANYPRTAPQSQIIENKVTSLKAVPRTTSATAALDVKWNNPNTTGNVLSYHVTVYQGNTYVAARKTHASSPSITFTGLKKNTSYTVKVKTTLSSPNGIYEADTAYSSVTVKTGK